MKQSRQLERLVIIEASGKEKTVSKHLKDLGLPSRVLSTRGHLFNLPKDELGLDLKHIKAENTVTLNPALALKLTKAAHQAKTIYLMTDNDVVGEVIARDFIEMTGRKDALRAKVRDLSPAGIKKALEEASPGLDHRRIAQGDATRVLDRIIGYMLPGEREGKAPHIPFGRIATPLLNLAVKSDPIALILRHSLPAADGGAPFKLTLPIRRSQKETGEALIRELARFDAHRQKIKTHHQQEVVIDEAEPFDGGKMLSQLSRETQSSIEETSKALQEAYEEGRLSYPRTDSQRLDMDTIYNLGRLGQHRGLPVKMQRLVEKWYEPYENEHRKEDAHSAVHPTDDSLMLSLDEEIQSLGDKAVQLTIRQIIAAATPHERHVVETGHVNPGHLIARYLKILGHDRGWQRHLAYRQGQLIADVIPDPLNPDRRTSRSKSKEQPNGLTIERIKPDQMLLDLMLKHDLGRPSTYAHHAKRLSKEYFFDDLKPRASAYAAIELAEKRLPLLLKIDLAKKIETILEDPRKNVQNKVKEALAVIGIRFDDLASPKRVPQKDLDLESLEPSDRSKTPDMDEPQRSKSNELTDLDR